MSLEDLLGISEKKEEKKDTKKKVEDITDKTIESLVVEAKKELAEEPPEDYVDSLITDIDDDDDVVVEENISVFDIVMKEKPVEHDFLKSLTTNDTPDTLIKKIEQRDFISKEVDDFDNPQPEDKATGCPVIGLFGEKGNGKTMVALSFPREKEKMVAISFDRKTKVIHETFFNNDPKIKVYNAVKYLRRHPSKTLLETSHKTMLYVRRILEKTAETGGIDYIFIDGIEIYAFIAEMAMRYENRLGAYENFKNRNLWKARKANIDQIHELATQTARKMVIYSTYPENDNFTDHRGEEINQKRAKWKDLIEKEIDDVLYVEKRNGVDKNTGTPEPRFFVYVDSGKFVYKTGIEIDVTWQSAGRLLSEQAKIEKRLIQ